MADEAEDPRVALRHLEDQVEQVADAHNFAAAEFVNFREKADAVAVASKKVVQTWQDLVEVADRKALYFTLELDTTGLYEQLNEAMNAIIDLGSMMPGGDSAMLDEQLAISRRISMELVGTKEADASVAAAATKAANNAAKAAAKAAQAAHDAAVKEAQRAFDSFISTTVDMGTTLVSESFAKAIVGEPEDIKKAFKDIFDSAFDSGLTQIPELRSAFQQALQGQELLIEIAEKRARLSETLESAEDRLTKALENQANAQSKVNKLASDRASVASKTASAFGFKFGEDIGAKAQADRLLEQYTAFEGNLKALQTKGFPSDIISQVIGLGAFAGNEAATGLLAMGDTDFAAFTTALTGISAIGAKIGDIQAGITFNGAQSAAASGLLGASASAEGALSARDALTIELDKQNALAQSEALLLQKKLGADLVVSLDPQSSQQKRELEIFSAQVAELTTGLGRGINDIMNNSALGKIPELLKAQEFKAVAAAVMPTGTKADPIVVTDPKVLEAVKASLTPAQQFNENTAAVQAANRAVADIVGGPGFEMADAASLGIADALFDKAIKAPGLQMAYQAADFGSLMTNPTGSRGPSNAQMDGMNITVNVAGSVTSDRGIAEMVRQIALENQNSGTEWTPTTSGVY